MELHRSPGRQVLPVVCLLAGVTLLAIGGEGGLLRTVAAAGGTGLGLVALVRANRPFRFVIGADGLTLRRPGLRRLVRWSELDAVVLDQPPPSPGTPASASSTPVRCAPPRSGPLSSPLACADTVPTWSTT